MNINLLPDRLKKKNKINNNIIKANIVIFFLIILLFCASFVFKLKKENTKKAITEVDEQLYNDKYIYSENVLKDIQTYNKSIDLYEQRSKNIITINKEDILSIFNKISINGDIIKIEYNANYKITITGIVINEQKLSKIINSFLKEGYTNINVIERKLINDNLIKFILEIKLL